MGLLESFFVVEIHMFRNSDDKIAVRRDDVYN